MIEFRQVHKVYRQGQRSVSALDGVSLTIGAGEFVAVTGPSGSGKSTLLHLAGGLDLPTSGEVLLDGQASHLMGDDQLTRLRRDRVGLVFQFFNLMPTLTVLENAALPLLVAGKRLAAVRSRAVTLLGPPISEDVGIAFPSSADRARSWARPEPAIAACEQARG